MPTQLLGAPQGWVALKIGCICHAPNQNGHPKPNGARHGMGAKTPFSFKKGVEILSGMQVVGLRMHGVRGYRGEGGYGLLVGGHVVHAWPMG